MRYINLHYLSIYLQSWTMVFAYIHPSNSGGINISGRVLPNHYNLPGQEYVKL